MEIKWTDEKKDMVISKIDRWMRLHEVTCGESVQQSDEPSIDAVNIMAHIVDVVFDDEDSDE